MKPFGLFVLEKTLKPLFSPRFWVISALLCFAGFVIVGYHQDQMKANEVLDEMAGKDANAATIALEYETHRQVLLLVSFTMILVAIFLRFRQLARNRHPAFKHGQSVPQTETAYSNAFQPIRTQEEIIGEDSAAHQTETGRKRASRIVTQIAQSTNQVVRMVKSRQ